MIVSFVELRELSGCHHPNAVRHWLEEREIIYALSETGEPWCTTASLEEARSSERALLGRLVRARRAATRAAHFDELAKLPTRPPLSEVNGS